MLQLRCFWKRRFGDRDGGFDLQFGEQTEVPVLRRMNTPGRRRITLYQVDRIAFAAKEATSLRGQKGSRQYDHAIRNQKQAQPEIFSSFVHVYKIWFYKKKAREIEAR